MPLQIEAEKGPGLSMDPRPPLDGWHRRNLDSARLAKQGGGALRAITRGEMAEKRWKPQNPGCWLQADPLSP